MLRIVNRKALKEKGIVYSNVHLLRMESEGKFPRRFNISQGRIAWAESEVDAWIKERMASRPKIGPTDAAA